MSIEFNCGQCGRLLRTGDDTAGRMAQCPECGSQTQVPTPATNDYQSSFPPVGGSGASDSYAPESAEFKGEQNNSQTVFGRGPGPGYPVNASYALQRVSAPATSLMIVAIIGIVLHVIGIISMNAGMIPQQAFHRGNVQIHFGPENFVFGVIGTIMGVVVLIGAMKMKALDNYGFAMTVSILAMIPCISPCCLLGLPFGIWALVVLSDPVVKSSFKS